jgi:hypothetical protein
MDLFLCPDERSLVVRCPRSSHSDGLVTCPDGISTGSRLASLFLSYTHLCIFIDLSCHVVCFSRGFLPRFWHSLHIYSHSMVFAVSSFVLLSFCAFQNIGIFGDWNFFFEILCMKILLCLCAGLILIYLCLMNSCIAYIFLWHPFDSHLKYHIIFGTNWI